MQDSKGKVIKVGDIVLFATWGMFDVHKSHWKESNRFKSGYYIERREDDPKYVTHLDHGIVDELLDEDKGILHVLPTGYTGVIQICLYPTWTDRGEYIEVIGEEKSESKEVVIPIININKIQSTFENVQDNIEGGQYDTAISILIDFKLSIDSMIEKLENWKKIREK